MMNLLRKCSGIIGIFILLMLTLSTVVLVFGIPSQVVGPKVSNAWGAAIGFRGKDHGFPTHERFHRNQVV